MPGGPLSTVLQHLRKIAGISLDASTTDGQLLMRFIQHRDEDAFDAIVRRHGPMVLNVCRRMLGDAHDAEDAFQATFLILVRKAGSVRNTESVGSWLYGVAYRTAVKARAAGIHRKRHEVPVSEVPVIAAAVESPGEDYKPLLDAELSRLPEKYRSPLVLCYLQGKTKVEAARELGWPEGTVSGRLARARDLLRDRLTRRGVTLSATALAAALSEEAASAAVPVPLIASTIQSALLFAAGTATAIVIPANVLTLTEGVLKAMYMTKLKIAVAMLVVASFLVAGTGFLALGALAQQQPAASPAQQTKADKPKDDNDSIQGTWKVIAAEINGDDAPDAEELKQAEWVIKAGKMVVKKGEESRPESSYKLDPAKKPKTIDVTPEDGPEKGQTFLGIYSLEGDTLKICFTSGGGGRPTEFATKPGGQSMLLTLQRQPKDKPAQNEKAGSLTGDAKANSAARIADLVKAKRDAARTAWDAHVQAVKAGRRSPGGEEVYMASRRLLEAEQELSAKKTDQLAALEAHFTRMKELDDIAKLHYDAGRATIQELSTARFFRLEAELWLEKAKAKE